MFRLTSIRLLVGLFFFSSSLFSQIETAQQKIDGGEFAEAIKILLPLTSDDDQKLLANFYLAKAHFDTANVNRNPDTALEFCNQTKAIYDEGKTKKNWKKPKAYRPYDLLKLTKLCRSEVANRLIDSGDRNLISNFLEKNSRLGLGEKKGLKNRLNNLYLEELKGGDYVNAKGVWDAKEKPIWTSISHRKKLEKLCYTLYVKENGWGIDGFKNEFKRHPVFLKKTLFATWDSIAGTRNYNLFTDFMKTNADTFFHEYARDTLADMEADRTLFIKNIEKVTAGTDNAEQEAADAECLRLLKKNKPIGRLEAEITTDAVPHLKQSIDHLAVLAMPDGTAEESQEFLKRYPDYHRAEELRENIYKLEAAKHRSQFEPASKYIRAHAPSTYSFAKLQKLIEFPIKYKKWEDALKTALEFRDQFGADTLYNDLISILEMPTEGLISEPIAMDIISTKSSEYTPVMSPDGKTLFFCRKSGFPLSEVIYSSTTEDGVTWTASQPVEGLQGTGNYAPVGIADDGTSLLIFKRGKLSRSLKTSEGWAAPVEYNENINIGRWQGTASFSSDGRYMIFESEARRDSDGTASQGSIDIFISEKQSDGTWGPAKNIGSDINTSTNDRSPFLHADNRTLYFSSQGYGGLGELDVFVTKRIGDSWFEWSKPKNLGKEVNTSHEDWGYRVSTDGKTAYFAADPEGRGQTDIYRSGLPQTMRPAPVTTISTIVTDDEGNPISATAIVKNTAGEVIKTGRTDPKTGEFQTTLPHQEGNVMVEIIPDKGLKKIYSN